MEKIHYRSHKNNIIKHRRFHAGKSVGGVSVIVYCIVKLPIVRYYERVRGGV